MESLQAKVEEARAAAWALHESTNAEIAALNKDGPTYPMDKARLDFRLMRIVVTINALQSIKDNLATIV
jgi:hypothetical protein